MWPASFQALVEAQFNVNGFNLPYHDARALECTYTEQNNRCVDNYRLRYIFHRIIYIDSFISNFWYLFSNAFLYCCH